MFWPFKRLPRMTFEELIADKPDAPCGSKPDHYRWRLIEGMPCPMCTAAKQAAQERERDERMADLIAEAVVRRLSKPQIHSIPQQEDQ